MLWLYRFISGYLIVEFFGEFSEQILNICAKNRISLWNSRCVKRKIICCITVRDFLRLPEVIRKKKIRVHILKKIGFPFFIAKYKKRFGFLLGIIIFISFLQFMSCFVWSIEVVGNHKLKDQEILEQCKQIGIYEGIRKTSVNPKIQKEKLLLNSEKLAWASLNIEGCRLTVNVSEVKEVAEDNTIPSNLKASADGIIKKVDITSGNCVVKVGDTVSKGDILVSGIIEKPEGTRFVHSIGTVTAKTERSIVVSGQFERDIEIETGKERSKSVLSFFGIKLPLYLGKEKTPYKSEINLSEAKLLGERLPITLHTKKFVFLEKRAVTLTDEELNTELQKKFEEEIKANKIGTYEVLDKKLTEIEGGLQLITIISAEEDIAYQDILLFNSGN